MNKSIQFFYSGKCLAFHITCTSYSLPQMRGVCLLLVSIDGGSTVKIFFKDGHGLKV